MLSNPSARKAPNAIIERLVVCIQNWSALIILAQAQRPKLSDGEREGNLLPGGSRLHLPPAYSYQPTRYCTHTQQRPGGRLGHRSRLANDAVGRITARQ